MAWPSQVVSEHRVKDLGQIEHRLKKLGEMEKLKLYLTKSLVNGRGWLIGTFGLPKLEKWMVRKRTPRSLT